MSQLKYIYLQQFKKIEKDTFEEEGGKYLLRLISQSLVRKLQVYGLKVLSLRCTDASESY